MAYYIAEGRSLNTNRGVIGGGDKRSEVTWKSICRDPENKELVKVSKASFASLLENGCIVEADEMPISPVELAEQQSKAGITQDVSLKMPPRDGNTTHKDPRDVAPKPLVQSVSMSAEAAPVGAVRRNE